MPGRQRQHVHIMRVYSHVYFNRQVCVYLSACLKIGRLFAWSDWAMTLELCNIKVSIESRISAKVGSCQATSTLSGWLFPCARLLLSVRDIENALHFPTFDADLERFNSSSHSAPHVVKPWNLSVGEPFAQCSFHFHTFPHAIFHHGGVLCVRTGEYVWSSHWRDLAGF